MPEILGIIAGSGQFPVQVARGARAQGLGVVMAGFHGHTDPAIAVEADAFAMMHLGQLNRLIDFFRGHSASRVCFAGAVSKPKALQLRPDLRVLQLMFRLRGKGDDAILRCLAEEFAGENLPVVQAASFVPGLAAPLGVVSARKPARDDWDDIRFGWPIARAVGQMDIGQCVVVRSGIVIAVEALEGTDAALERGGLLGGRGCTAIKIFKPGQDERIDQPAIGPRTFALMARCGYACIAYQAGKTLFFDPDESLAIADRANIAVIGLPDDGPGEDIPDQDLSLK